MRYGILFCFATVLCSCARTKDTHTQPPGESDVVRSDTSAVPITGRYVLDHYLTSGPEDTATVMVIDYDCALFVDPTESQVREMRTSYGEEDYAIVAEDNSWYRRRTVEMLDSMKLHHLTATRPFVTFYGREGRWTLNVRKKGALPWNLIFFSTNKKPEIVSPVNLTPEDINEYFRRSY